MKRSIKEWQTIIETARSSGMSDKDWCLANGISLNTFYYNIRRIRNLACEIPPKSKVRISPKQDIVPLEIVDEIECKNVNSTTAISINCNGINISISNSASDDIVKAVINALRG